MILDGQLPSAIHAAAQALQRGELLGLPTETVYGLAADAGNDAAVTRIFEAKGRPADHPLIVHVVDAQAAMHFAAHTPAYAQRLMAAFWPGPLTLILPRHLAHASTAAGGQNSVGLRCPSHPVAQALLKAAQSLGVLGVAAPSANLFGRVSPTTAAHVADEFGDGLLILDGGACAVGIESTIVDCTRAAPVLLRPGVLTPAQLSLACGTLVQTPDQPQPDAPRASGTLDAHYAPRAQVRLMSVSAIEHALAHVTAPLAQAGVAVWSRTPVHVPAAHASQVRSHAMPASAQACAHVLFAQLRDFDAQGMAQIWVETPPSDAEWDGVRDRLTRASVATR